MANESLRHDAYNETLRHDVYKDGLRDGKILALEEANKKAHERIDSHESRLTAQERITYALLGALTLMQIWPAVQQFLSQQ